MTTVALKANPKVYWIWNHRRWCLESVPDGPGGEDGDPVGWKKANWEKELFVVEKMLDVDSRNCAWLIQWYDLQPQHHSQSLPGITGDMSWPVCPFKGHRVLSWRTQRGKSNPIFPTLVHGINARGY